MLKLPKNMGSNAMILLSKTKFKLQKKSPELLLLGGIIGLVSAGITACFATTKLPEIAEMHKEQIDTVKKKAEDLKVEVEPKQIAKVYASTGWRLFKLYAPSIVLAGFSITGLVASNDIHKKRGAAMAALYTATDKGYKAYRKAVVDRFGEDVDKELKYGIKPEEVNQTIVDAKGKEKTVKKKVDTVDEDYLKNYSPFAKFFDEANPNWEKDAEYNKSWLRLRQSLANDQLKARGYMYLNDVYDLLGIRRTKAGYKYGWIFDVKNPKRQNFIDFGIYDIHKAGSRDFVNGLERSILLDFNVDGVIYADSLDIEDI